MRRPPCIYLALTAFVLFVVFAAGAVASWKLPNMKTVDNINANNYKVQNVAAPTASTDAATKQYVDDNAGGGSADHAYYARLAALIEPDAIEYPRYGLFTYAVGASETRYFLLGWYTYIDPNSGARYDVRNPVNPLPLRNVTIKGGSAASTGIFLNPDLPTYADARTTYYDRLETIATLRTRSVYNNEGSANNWGTLLPGPYGSILTSVMCFDYGWVALGANGIANTGFPLDYETNDSSTYPIRFQHTMMLPVTKAFINSIYTGYPKDAGARGVITWVDVSSTWSAVTDPLAPYDFRDDFMGTALDTTTTWTRAQSTAGNVEFDSMFSWLKLTGNNAWSTNGVYAQTGQARSSQPVLLVDVHILDSASGAGSPGIVGFSDGAGHSYTNMAHGLYFSTGGLYVFENGNNRGAVGSGYTVGQTYRVRITALSGGGATYEIQGGTQYNQIGSGTWNNITPGTTTSATSTLHAAAATNYNGLAMYLSDMRVYTP